jgi:hypothetical protein
MGMQYKNYIQDDDYKAESAPSTLDQMKAKVRGGGPSSAPGSSHNHYFSSTLIIVIRDLLSESWPCFFGLAGTRICEGDV